MKRNPTLSRMFVVSFLLFLMLPLAAVVTVFLVSSYASQDENVKNRLSIVATSLSDRINDRLDNPYRFLESVAEMAGKYGQTDEHLDTMLSSGIKSFKIFEAIYILDREGRISLFDSSYYKSYDRSDFIGIPLPEISYKTGVDNKWSRAVTSPLSNNMVVRAMVAFDNGYVVGDISTEFISEMLAESVQDNSTQITITGADGQVIASSVRNMTGNLSKHPLMTLAGSFEPTMLNYHFGKDERVGTIKTVRTPGWFLLYEQTASSAYVYFTQILLMNVGSAAVLIGFSLFILFFIRAKVIVPMRLLTERSEMIAQGTFLQFRDSEKGVFKELRTLYDSFEKMMITINRREKELKDKEEYLRSVFDSTTTTGILIISTDAEPIIMDANVGAQIIFGYKLSEMLGLPPAGLIKALGNELADMCSESRRTDAMVTKQLEMVKKNGMLFPVLCSVYPLFGSNGNIMGFICVCIDITEITRVQNELESEKERLDVTLRSIGEGVVAADKFGRITLVNSSAENILGQKYRFILGHNINEVIQVYDYETGKSLSERITDLSPKSNRTFRANMVTKDAGVITVFITSSAMTNNKGEIIGSVYVFRDITDRMKMEQELINRKKMLEDINRSLEKRVQVETEKRRKNEQMLFEQAKFAAMGQMISAIAHQWRQPLNALALYVQDIEDAYETGEVDKLYLMNFSSNAMRLIDHMSATIDDFRNFFHSANSTERVDIPSVILESMSLVTTQFRSQMINYKVIIRDNGKEQIFENKLPDIYEPINDIKLTIFSSELKQVMLNIYQNARDAIIEYRKETGEKIGNIITTLTFKSDRLKIEIENDGGNIPEETLGRIFDPYFTTKAEGEGTGIGLYMSKIIIEDHMDGLLVAQNTKNGALFSITLTYDNK
ncbi:PAS domain S-box protein [Seleniivibrio sp.]|uniref:PAS domain S-box protein n=1 Tax=Seleniivibrio sp. TaxID=2898801 RepID=UPI0025D4D915|nr:PAS domain S-box protein [Seleniivibrio sp.]MCD8553404.1 PAS domain S-box protein [Seleniivibrio sp.]